MPRRAGPARLVAPRRAAAAALLLAAAAAALLLAAARETRAVEAAGGDAVVDLDALDDEEEEEAVFDDVEDVDDVEVVFYEDNEDGDDEKDILYNDDKDFGDDEEERVFDDVEDVDDVEVVFYEDDENGDAGRTCGEGPRNHRDIHAANVEGNARDRDGLGAIHEVDMRGVDDADKLHDDHDCKKDAREEEQDQDQRPCEDDNKEEGEVCGVDEAPTMCGVVALFNPAKYASRLENYRKFRERSRAQGLWLMVVQLLIDDAEDEDLVEIDADAVIRLRGDERHVLWQKERLLNIGLAHLPADACAGVVWPDADMLFDNAQWVEATRAALQAGAKVVQPFQYVVRLPVGVDWLDPSSARVSLAKDESVRTPGFAFAVASAAGRGPGRREAVLASQQQHGYTGFAWAASRAALEEMGGLFDLAVVGGADALMAHAFAGHFAKGGRVPYYYASRLAGAASPLALQFRAWAERAEQATRGELGWVPGTALHLWHGSKANRQYGSRFDILHGAGQVDFDPASHLEQSACTVVTSTVKVRRDAACFLWRWRAADADAERMRLAVKSMFRLRSEDG